MKNSAVVWSLLSDADESRCRWLSPVDSYLPLGDSVTSYKKTVRHIMRSFINYKTGVLRKEILNLEPESVHSSQRGVRLVCADEDSKFAALCVVDRVAAEMSFPNVNVDNRGCVCFEWGSVYGRYLLLRFTKKDECILFFQNSAEDDIQYQSQSILPDAELEHIRLLPWRM